jgi:hypothetical protein
MRRRRRILTVYAVAATALALAAVPSIAIAGKGGGGASSSIAIASVNGTDAGRLPAAATPKLGDMLKFATTVEPLAGWEYPMVVTSCYQDVNGDNWIDTNMLGPDIVYSWVDHPDAEFLLGAYDSIWKQRGGGDATCRAELDAYGWKGGKQSVRVLASTGDWAASG